MLTADGRGGRALPRPIRRVARLVLLPLAVGGVILVASRALPRSADAPFAALVAQRTAADTTMRAVVVASPQDCRGNLSLAAVFARPAVRQAVGTPLLLINGTAADTLGLRPLLHRALARSDIHLLSAAQRRVLLMIGQRETPSLLLFDSAGRLRMATHVEANPVARVAFMRALVHVSSVSPTH